MNLNLLAISIIKFCNGNLNKTSDFISIKHLLTDEILNCLGFIHYYN